MPFTKYLTLHNCRFPLHCQGELWLKGLSPLVHGFSGCFVAILPETLVGNPFGLVVPPLSLKQASLHTLSKQLVGGRRTHSKSTSVATLPVSYLLLPSTVHLHSSRSNSLRFTFILFISFLLFVLIRFSFFLIFYLLSFFSHPSSHPFRPLAVTRNSISGGAAVFGAPPVSG